MLVGFVSLVSLVLGVSTFDGAVHSRFMVWILNSGEVFQMCAMHIPLAVSVYR